MRPKLATVLSAASVLAAAFLWTAPVATSAPPAERQVRLRIHQRGGDTVVQAPLAFLRAIAARPSGTTVPLGAFRGRPVRLSLDRLVRDLAKPRDPGPEDLLFSRTLDGGPMDFYAKAVDEPAPDRSGTPLLAEVEIRSLGGAAPNTTRLVLPLAASPLVAALPGLLGQSVDADLGPFLESAVDAAREVGTGPLVTATAPDARASVRLR